MTLNQAAERVGVTPATLRRWIKQGLIPQHDGAWSPAAIGQARGGAKMRERGHSLQEIRQATEQGKLAFGFLEELVPTGTARYTVKEAAEATGVHGALARGGISGPGVTPESTRP